VLVQWNHCITHGINFCWF